MFTGIVEGVGRVAALEPRGGDVRLVIDVPDGIALDELRIGDSISVSGVCLTVVARATQRFAADVSTETLACTSLGALAPGDGINLERALRFSDRLGGHLVSGHVDGIGKVLAIEAEARGQRWRFAAPAELRRFIAAKGSIAIDGVSLTVNEVDAESFGVMLIPHTIAATTFAQRKVGAVVNLEIDLIARYVERLIEARAAD
jgi:riboflavin synthase